MTLVSFIAFPALILLLIEVAARTLKLPKEMTRKGSHIVGGLAAALGPLYLSPLVIALIALLFAGGLLVVRRTNLLTSVHGVNRKSLGDVLLPTGIAATALLFGHSFIAYEFGILVVTFADTAAALVGKTVPSVGYRFLGAERSFAGSAAFFAAALALGVAVVPIPTAMTALIALALTFAEAASVRGTDNLVLPVLAAALALLALGG